MNVSHGFDGSSFHVNGLGPRSPSTFPWSTAIAYLCFLGLIICQALHYFDYPVPTTSELAWRSLVYLTPSRVISILDKRTVNSAMDGRNKRWGHARKSEAMRHILGPNGDAFIHKLQYTANIPVFGNLFHTTLAKGSSEKPPGLGNWDNSCYQNSVIQGLASLPSLSTFLNAALSTRIETSNSIREALSSFITMLNDPSSSGKLFWMPEELKTMSSWQQQDAQEYFSKLLDEVEREMLKMVARRQSSGGLSELASLSINSPESNNGLKGKADDAQFTKRRFSARLPKLDQLPDELTSVLTRNPLEGLLAQRVGCVQCGFVEGLSLVPFNCLTVPLGKHWMYDVRTCLDDYTALEHIRGVECTKCTLLMNKKQLERLLPGTCDQSLSHTASPAPHLTEAQLSSWNDRLLAVSQALDDDDFSDHTLLRKCHISPKTRISTTKTRQAVVARAPKSLVIHINRSVFDESSGLQCKNHADVIFPRELDLAPWCLGSRTSRHAEEVAMEDWSLDPSKSMLPPETQELNSESEVIYDLRAVITHYGRHENGHYICYRKLPARSQTATATAASSENADCWWRLSDEEVSRVSEERVLAQGGVFMLFYEKIQPPALRRHIPPLLVEPADTSIEAPVQTPVENRLENLAEKLMQSPLATPVKTPVEIPVEASVAEASEVEVSMDAPVKPSGETTIDPLSELVVEPLVAYPVELPPQNNSNSSPIEPSLHDPVSSRKNQPKDRTPDLLAATADQAVLTFVKKLEPEISLPSNSNQLTTAPDLETKPGQLWNTSKAANSILEPDHFTESPGTNSLSIRSHLQNSPSLAAAELPTPALLFPSSSSSPVLTNPHTNPLFSLSFEALNDNSMSPKPELPTKQLSSPPMRTATPHGSRGSVSLVDQGMVCVGSMVEAN